MKTMLVAVLLCFAVAIAACGSDDQGSDTGDSANGSAEATAENASFNEPKVEVPNGPAPKKLITEDLEEGSGVPAQAGDEVTVQYVGVEFNNGNEIDSSWDRGEPLSFTLGAGEVIPGWEQGVEGMKQAGRRQLVIPSELAYGRGALVFIVDLLEIGSDGGPGGEPGPQAEEKPKPNVKVPAGPPPTEVVVNDLEEGTGPGVKDGDEIVVNYVGVSYKTGKEFENTFAQGPTTFPVGGEVLIDGWEEGMQGMKAGGRRELLIPSKKAFKRGPVVYVVDLLEIK